MPAEFYQDIEALDVRENGEGIAAFYREGWTSERSEPTTWKVPMAGFNRPADLFGDQVYRRGALALGYLVDQLGADKFAEVMRTWAERGRTQPDSTVTTKDFLALVEKKTGYDTDTFTREWVESTHAPRWPQ